MSDFRRYYCFISSNINVFFIYDNLDVQGQGDRKSKNHTDSGDEEQRDRKVLVYGGEVFDIIIIIFLCTIISNGRGKKKGQGNHTHISRESGNSEDKNH